ncbi:alpha/beta hydrolase-fold protein [Ruminococcus sp.]|uniref:alpha/beta hydrolase n=1 Tax=Ruminococcus sp. TaxID=41978 RepID=UPI0025F1F371|nr:alpha/beta hydrolase-fold protein [Ruminococcus sp.]MCR4639274.1 alpha/beta hydrolase [Ruminococcus sp.]
MKRSLAFLLSLTLLFSAGSCSTWENSPETDSQTVSGEIPSEKIQLTNHMTENERSKVKVGELTVFDHMQNEQKNEASIPEDGVYIELWSEDDYIADLKKRYEKDPSILAGDSIENAIELSRPYFNEVYNVFVNGSSLPLSDLFPIIGYDGGELKLREPCPIYCCTDEKGEFYHVDENNNRIPEDEVQEKYDEFYAKDSYVTFADFEEFKPYLREKIERMSHVYDTQGDEESIKEYIEQMYENTIAAWEAVINNTYKTLPVGTSEKIFEAMDSDTTDTWEIDREKIEAIAPYVKEYSIYDEQLDTDFIVHVTLPPEYDKDKTYPVYVLTDGVWRFNNSADLRKSMEEGKASDVIIVSIGYDYSIDGTNDTYRIKYFCDRCEEFLAFITDDLMPYLGEEYNIDFGDSTLYGHSLGGTFAHYAVFNSDKYENQPFKNYIIGSPTFWSPGFLPYTDGDKFKHEYGYFERNKGIDKTIFVCGGADEDPVYEEYYKGNDSTLEGIQHLMERLNEYGVTTAECKIYPNSEHYQFIPEMLVEMLEKYYPAI